MRACTVALSSSQEPTSPHMLAIKNGDALQRDVRWEDWNSRIKEFVEAVRKAF